MRETHTQRKRERERERERERASRKEMFQFYYDLRSDKNKQQFIYSCMSMMPDCSAIFHISP